MEDVVTEKIGALTRCLHHAGASAEIWHGDIACAPYSECVYIKVEAPDPALLLVQEWRSAAHLSSNPGM